MFRMVWATISVGFEKLVLDSGCPLRRRAPQTLQAPPGRPQTPSITPPGARKKLEDASRTPQASFRMVWASISVDFEKFALDSRCLLRRRAPQTLHMFKHGHEVSWSLRVQGHVQLFQSLPRCHSYCLDFSFIIFRLHGRSRPFESLCVCPALPFKGLNPDVQYLRTLVKTWCRDQFRLSP